MSLKILENYNFDPSYYFSSSGFAWDAMSEMTGASWEVITDIDMYISNGRRRSA